MVTLLVAILGIQIFLVIAETTLSLRFANRLVKAERAVVTMLEYVMMANGAEQIPPELRGLLPTTGGAHRG